MKEDKNQLVDLELKSLEGAPDIYSLKINGKEIGQFVSELHLDLKAHEFPTLTIKLNTEKLSIQSRAILEIPEPYKCLMKVGHCTQNDDLVKIGHSEHSEQSSEDKSQ